MSAMKFAFKTFFGIVGLSALCAAAPAHAVAISASHDPNDTLMAPGAALSFDLDLTGGGYVPGNTIDSAVITIHLTDAVQSGPNHETYRYEIGSVPQIAGCAHGNCVPNPGVTDIIALDAAAIADLALDGKIGVKVSALSGGFTFAYASLTARVPDSIQVTELDAPTGNVPEPSTLLLLGAGLIALGSRLRRRG